jgi:hypothetical protein
LVLAGDVHPLEEEMLACFALAEDVSNIVGPGRTGEMDSNAV